MLRNPIKLKLRRKKCLPQSCSKNILDDKTNIEQIKTSSAVYKEEYLIDRNLSIITDTQLESDVVDKVDVRLRQKKPTNARTSNSSSSADSQDSYVLIAHEEIPVTLKDTNWEYVKHYDESVQSNSNMKKYCSPKCSSAWFLNIRREIMKNCCNKIHPRKMDR